MSRSSTPKREAAVPRGYHTVTLALVVDDGAKALDFYARALGARERNRMPGPGGKIWHAEIEVGDSVIMRLSSNSRHRRQAAPSSRCRRGRLSIG
jgi:PhnB protein